ncbi:MAG: sialidase family protein [Burkholderiales bacterium]
MIRTLFAALAFCLAAHAAAHEGHPKSGATEGRRNGPILGASAAFDAHGTLWAVHFDGPHLVVSRSTDFGAHWSPPRRVLAAPEPMDGGGDAKPNLALGPDGEIFVTWTKPLSKPYTGEVRFVRSLDGGATFSAPKVVHADRQEITHRFDAMTVTPGGRLVVAWIDKRDGVAKGGKPGSYAGAAVYYAVSDDRGATFRGDYRIAEHSCECCRIALLPQPDGQVLGFWRHVFEPNVRDHAVGTFGEDGKVLGFYRATFDDWRVDVCPHHGPSLGMDGTGRLHAVWFTGATGREGVWYGRPGREGVAGQRRVGGDTAEHADLAVAGDRVVIAWKEFDGARSVLRVMRSADRGATFSEGTLAATADASDQPRVLLHDGRFFVFWNTRSEPLRVFAL